MKKLISISALLSTFFLVACGGGQHNDSRNGTVDPVTSIVLDSANEALYKQVFAAPTTAELAQVRAEFLVGDRSGLDFAIEDTGSLGTIGGQQERATIISYSSDGFKQYGAVVFPAHATRTMPLLLLSHPGDGGVDVGSDIKLILLEAPLLAQNFVIVIPSFRSEAVEFNKKTWTSEGGASPWGRDVLDGLRMVSAVESLSVATGDTAGLPSLDTTKLASIGFSRGGGVALLASLRDPRIHRVVDYFGPTDFYGTYSERIFRQMMNGVSIDLPGIKYLDSAIVKPLLAGTLSIDSARLELLRRSPAQFADSLPPVMIHHGLADSTVLVSQSQDLWNALSEKAKVTLDSSYFFTYPNVGHTPVGMQANIPKSEEFLMQGIPTAELARRSAASIVAEIPTPIWIRTGFSAQ